MPVYIARFGLAGPIKIGCTLNVAVRLEQLGGKLWDEMYLLRLFDGARADEAKLHRRFQQQRIKHEWFHYHPDMMGDLGLPEITRELSVALNTYSGRSHLNEKDRQIFAAALRAWMVKKDLREDELAPLVGCSRGTVSDWLRFGCRPSFRFHQKLVDLSDGELASALEALAPTTA